MSKVIGALKAIIDKHHQQVRSRKFLEAAMGACALLALADGEISFAELMARDYILDRVKELQAFDPNEAAELFRTYAEGLEANRDKVKPKVLEAVSQFSDDRDLAPLLIRISVAISKADYDFSELERKEIDLLCNILGLDPMKFDAEDYDAPKEET